MRITNDTELVLCHTPNTNHLFLVITNPGPNKLLHTEWINIREQGR